MGGLRIPGGRRIITPSLRSRHALRRFKSEPGAAPGGEFALLFPQNVAGDDQAAPYGALEFDRPDTNGLPIFGVSNNGVTVVRKIKTTSPSQEGYYAQFWYCQGDGSIDSSGYWGCHPYPLTTPGVDATTHCWEVAAMGQDWVDFESHDLGAAGGQEIDLGYGTTYTQIINVTYVSTNLKTVEFFIDAADTDAPNFVLGNMDSAGYGEGSPPNPHPKIVIGDSPWFAGFQHERFGGVLDAIKIITPKLSLADAKLEGADFSQMVTAGGISGIWWGKNGFDSVDDLTCSYGTARSFTRVDASNVITTTARL